MMGVTESIVNDRVQQQPECWKPASPTPEKPAPYGTEQNQGRNEVPLE